MYDNLYLLLVLSSRRQIFNNKNKFKCKYENM